MTLASATDARPAAAIDSAGAAVAAARELAGRFADGAIARDRERRLPHAEVEYLSDAGLFALTVPARFGGPDLPPSVVAEVFRTLATADGSLAQIPHSHYVYLTALRLAGSEALQRKIFEQVLDGARIANAQSERGGRTVADVTTTLTRTAEGAHLDGEKFYCTGSPYAHLLAVLARDAGSGEQVVVFVPADTPGIAIADDWNALGQRTTGSGTVRFDDVAVPLDAILPRSPAVSAPTGYGAFAQLLHVAIDTGVARGALEAAADSPETVARRIAATIRTLGVDRFDLKYDQPVTHADLMESISLYGEQVVPLVKDMLSD
ncbi:acyl-CoA dehydrogenase family protein [Tsukamurella paurometabola]|uniref:acyl-CoA dehydrogenase family protein n=1 Tax=Tsukamurella paurometabola TaxID=2061 RepID=UPI000F7F71C0|nr:acyl-CoA dehydrogenase family protein [Tsukamurella paurometabola]